MKCHDCGKDCREHEWLALFRCLNPYCIEFDRYYRLAVPVDQGSGTDAHAIAK